MILKTIPVLKQIDCTVSRSELFIETERHRCLVAIKCRIMLSIKTTIYCHVGIPYEHGNKSTKVLNMLWMFIVYHIFRYTSRCETANWCGKCRLAVYGTISPL